MTIQALVTGCDTDPLFFADILHALHRPNVSVTVRSVDQVESWPPADLLVVLQLWPDEYTRADVLRLLDAAPLSRLIVCYGPWCDSDGRTRDLWPQGCRVPMALAPSRLRQELADLSESIPPLPRTATRNEAFNHAHRRPFRECSTPLVIGITSLDRALAETVPNILSAAGHSVVYERFADADVVIWDAELWGPAACEELTALKFAASETPIVALCGFPRLHEVRELHDAGIAGFILNSAENDLLIDQLERFAAPNRSQHSITIDRVTPFGSRSVSDSATCPD